MNLKNLFSAFGGLFLITVFAFSSCKKQVPPNDDPDHENELITTIRITLLYGDTQSFTWRQPGGPGTAIQVDTLRLKSNQNYVGWLTLFDESKTPAVDLTEEISDRSNEHRFIFTPSLSRVGVTITDFDNQNPPMELGLNFTVAVSNMGDSTGTLRIVLRHYTNASPKSAGLSAGTTDADVSFPMMVN